MLREFVYVDGDIFRVQDDILLALWFCMPLGAANAAPVVVAKLPLLRGWNAPLDGGRSFRGRRLLGSHKTWRGVVSGMVAATLVLWWQQYLVAQGGGLAELVASIDYESLPTLIVGPLLAIGALGGDAVKSFFKRRRGIPAGKPWFPFDQLDIFLGAIIVMPFVVLSFAQYVWVAVICLLAQLAFSYGGYFIGIKERPI